MNTLIISMSIWLKPNGTQAMMQFQELAMPLFARHKIKIERVILAKSKGQIVGKNEMDIPDLIQIVSAPSLEAFQQYLKDPEYLKIAPIRDEACEKILVSIGSTIDVSEFNPISSSTKDERLYGIGFVQFKEDGRDKLLHFNRLAIDLYKRHGMHVETMFDVKNNKASVGELPNQYSPQLIVSFFLDSESSLKNYITDPEYIKLAPIRDQGLKNYDFFIGKTQ